MTFASIKVLHEPYAHLYVGDYFADTLDLAAHEHRAFRLLLLETWVRGPVGNLRLPAVAGLTKADWQTIKPSVLPLLRSVQPRIAESLKHIHAFDGQRLPADVWHIVRSIVLERDGRTCTYCGSDKRLEGDHIVPLSRGGSNAFTNLATACRPCICRRGRRRWRSGVPCALRRSWLVDRLPQALCRSARRCAACRGKNRISIGDIRSALLGRRGRSKPIQ